MKDFSGKLLNIGDEVAFSVNVGDELTRGVIKNFRPDKFYKIVVEFTKNGLIMRLFTNPDKIVKI